MRGCASWLDSIESPVDLFTTDEAERYVGHDNFVLLSELGADVTALLRSLEMIRQIEGDVSGLRTKSDVYWRSLIGVLQRALHRQPADLQLTESNALYLFSLIAHEMTKREFRANVAGIRDIEKLDEVLWEIFESRKTQPSFKTRAKSFEDFKTKLSRMMAVNEYLADPVLVGSGGPSVVQLLWRNQTLMDMFAALWLTRFATQEDERAWFRKAVGDKSREELCQLVVEMPRAALAPADTTQFPSLVGFLTERPVKERPRTAHLYRVWPQLLQIAGYWPAIDATPGAPLTWERQLRLATEHAQRDAWQRVEQGQSLADPANLARESLRRYLGEFPTILKGEQGTAAQDIARKFDQGFRPIPKKPGDSLTFPFGANDDNPGYDLTIPAPFEMAQYTVTNELYALFDPTDASRRATANRRHSPDTTCPVIGVDWYDAWCCSAWLGGYLPTEEEWEYACRAGSQGTYYFPTEESFADHVWYVMNSMDTSHPVGNRKPNAWDLFDTLGASGNGATAVTTTIQQNGSQATNEKFAAGRVCCMCCVAAPTTTARLTVVVRTAPASIAATLITAVVFV